MKYITNKNLLGSTENSTQYSAMTYMTKESKKEWIYIYVESKKEWIYIYVCVCIYIYDSLCCTAETNITLKINYTPIQINKNKNK